MTLQKGRKNSEHEYDICLDEGLQMLMTYSSSNTTKWNYQPQDTEEQGKSEHSSREKGSN